MKEAESYTLCPNEENSQRHMKNHSDNSVRRNECG